MRWFFIIALLASNLAWSDSQELFVPSTREQLTRVELFEFTSLQKQSEAMALAKSLRCPQCQNQNLVESNSPIALDLRLMVFEMINQGQSQQEVIQYMTERYGDFVLYKPPFTLRHAILWCLPVLVLVIFIFRASTRIVRKKHGSAEGEN